MRTRSEALELCRRLVRAGFYPGELVLRRCANRGRTYGVEVTREAEERRAREGLAAYHAARAASP